MKTDGLQYDAIVIGAGPAGSCAAQRLAQAGLNVLLAEQRKEIGDNIQCAEFVPRLITKYVKLRTVDVAQEIKGIKTFICQELVSILRAPGYILNRKFWDRQLADEAAKAGARVMTGGRVIDADHGTVTLATGVERKTIAATFILGCDGPRSLIRQKLGNQPAETCIAMQYEMYLIKPLDYACIYFDPMYYGGYAWAFPKGETVNIGLAVHASYAGKMKHLLDDFRLKMLMMRVVRDTTVRSANGGVIPSGGLADCLGNRDMLVAGDAAGCTHPITGAGIMNAVISGQIAAATVLKQINEGTKFFLAESYTRALSAEYGEQLKKARDRLIVRDQGWTEDKGEFTALIRRSWIAFPEYYTAY